MALSSINRQSWGKCQIKTEALLNFSATLQVDLETIRYPINAEEVGRTELENPSPNWNARTAVCLVIPIRSATGTINGMVTAACPAPDVMTQFTSDCAKNIPTAFKD